LEFSGHGSTTQYPIRTDALPSRPNSRLRLYLPNPMDRSQRPSGLVKRFRFGC